MPSSLTNEIDVIFSIINFADRWLNDLNETKVARLGGILLRTQPGGEGGWPNAVTISDSDVIIVSNNDVILRSEGGKGSKKA